MPEHMTRKGYALEIYWTAVGLLVYCNVCLCSFYLCVGFDTAGLQYVFCSNRYDAVENTRSLDVVLGDKILLESTSSP